MAWLRVGSNVAKLTVRRTISQAGSYAAPQRSRYFHATVYRSKAQSSPVPRPVPLQRLSDSFLHGTSSVYLEELQRAWEQNPNSVDESWDNFFRNFVGQVATSPGLSGQIIQESMRLLLLVRSYQVYGHLKAMIDPLGLEERSIPDDLDPALYGFSEADLDREFFVGVWRMAVFLSENHPVQTLRAILKRLEQAYCGSIGYEYMHIADREKFGLEGCETLIPGMKEMFDRSADLGVESIIFNEFSGGTKPLDEVGLYTGTGDVKYHLGTSYDRATRGGKRIHLSLVANPSHLEAVDPVVVGKTRAKQYFSNDVDRTKNLGILIHGDGSFAGQGVVYETLHLSALPNYTTGGTIHVVVNNQVAFTTDPRSGRSSQYCTDVAKALSVPIFHVNGDDVEAVVNACELAAEWRYKESPICTRDLPKEASGICKDCVPQKRDWFSAYWTGFKSPEQLSHVRNTGVNPEILKNVGKAITNLPEQFKPHRAGNHVRLSGQDVERGTFSHRHSVLHDQETGEKYCPLDHVMMNQHEEMFNVFIIYLRRIIDTESSSLSEFGVLGFELGYSMENPNSLVLWETQFGDFSNGAQVMFDQFVSSGEAKWLRQTGLVVLLRHGYDGQGPELSSARLERFLQMSDDHPSVIPDEMEATLRKQIQQCNWQLVNIHREFRKPLIVMSPKNLLRHKDCKSNLSEFDDVQGHQGFDTQGTRCIMSLTKAGAKDVAICRVEQLCPFPYDLVESCGSCVVPGRANEHGGIQLHRISSWQYDESCEHIGRALSAATATGFTQVHTKEQTEIVQKAMQPDPIN
ncbi:hypothetical protein SASPL_115243 [Salvia splendens]|uniref:2-oxoglutarate dehydrogenase, mitochondrial n=1 Tax=Salvia splendens TaxID=180675 RepID=A0A8X8VWD3_SALSN|nr:hypothetical protein SASPL_156770 [Salvia splendens]KAG6424823.1 hypothetical protein SASPL_115243 [Salvia splendens]